MADSWSDDDCPPKLVPADTPAPAPPAAAAETSADEPDPCPISIITGYLGSGKTTFVNYVLTQRHGFRIAVIKNEFGSELGMEKTVLEGPDGEVVPDIFELPNGCICCSVRGELLGAVDNLLQQRSRFDYILLETTGLADPGSVAPMFWTDANLGSRVLLDGIITFVDTKYIEKYLAEKRKNGAANEAQRQIAYADTVVINKIDLVGSDHVQRLNARVRSINATARILTSSYSSVPLDDVLHLNAFSVSRARSVAEMLRLPECSKHAGEHEDCGEHGSSAEIEVKEDAVKRWIGELLWAEAEKRRDGDAFGEDAHSEAAESIYRVKGILAIEGETNKGVQELFDIEHTKEEWDTPRSCRFVFIGKNLNKAKLETSFLSACGPRPA